MRVDSSLAIALTFAAAAVLALSACGQKGPLVLPTKPSAVSASTPSSAPVSR